MSDDIWVTQPVDLAEPPIDDTTELHDAADVIDVDVERLAYGESGPSVVALQHRLADLDSRPLVPSGEYDDDTDAAVRRVQRYLGFRPDPAGESRVTREQAERIFLNTVFRAV